VSCVIFEFDGFEVDGARFELRSRGKRVNIQPKALELLLLLLLNRSRMVRTAEISGTLWPSVVVGADSLTKAVYGARRALREGGLPREAIRTVWGRGYQFTEPVFERRGEVSSPEAPAMGHDSADLAVRSYDGLAVAVPGVLQQLIPKLAASRTTHEVSTLALDGLKRAFGARIACAVVLDGASRIRERTIYGLRDADFEEWDRDWRSLDPVFSAALARAMPVHNDQIFAAGEWQRLDVYKGYARRLKVDRYMAVPMFGSRGALVGALTMVRRSQDRPFDAGDLASASLFSGFLSATIARVTEATPGSETGPHERPAPRELQVASLQPRQPRERAATRPRARNR
jgi:DNA-binding winged helix-turn-helix (wHTH) protein